MTDTNENEIFKSWLDRWLEDGASETWTEEIFLYEVARLKREIEDETKGCEQ